MKERILIIEDDKVIMRFVNLALSTNDYEVVEATSGLQGINAFINNKISVILLDLGLPDIDGIKVLTQIRADDKDIPMIIVSARDREEDKVKALDLGADDYLTKPFGVSELLARIRAVLRRKNPIINESNIFSYKDLIVDQNKRRVFLKGSEIHFTPLEYSLLILLITNQGSVLTHKFLQEKVWGYGSLDDYKTLRVFMASIRRKLDNSNNNFIGTEIGIGYRFNE